MIKLCEVGIALSHMLYNLAWGGRSAADNISLSEIYSYIFGNILLTPFDDWTMIMWKCGSSIKLKHFTSWLSTITSSLERIWWRQVSRAWVFAFFMVVLLKIACIYFCLSLLQLQSRRKSVLSSISMLRGIVPQIFCVSNSSLLG